MTTTKKRLNISLSPDLEKILEKVATRDRMPQATKAADLLKVALEIEEDVVFASIAESRDKKDTKFISHKKVWS